MSGINYAPIGRPFVMTAVILAFVGVTIGTVWMFSFFGIGVPEFYNVFQIHKTIQLEGFLTLLIMGVGYVIIPRFRNVSLPSNKLAIASFLLVVASLVLESVQKIGGYVLMDSEIVRLAGVLIFAAVCLYTIRTKPKLLREADYFLVISISVLVFVHMVPVIGGANTGSLNYIQMWLLFPILAIFGVEYKTLPSFLGYIRPNKVLTVACIGAALTGCIVGAVSLYVDSTVVSVAFNGAVIVMTALFAILSYVYGGYDNREILNLMRGEKKARYDMVVRHTRIGFAFLFGGFAFGILFYLQNGFLFYDLAIHYVAIGFVGITIMLFLPMMLPPIVGKTIQFMNFSKVPLLLLLVALALRTAGDYVIDQSIQNSFSAIFAASGILVLASMFAFVVMIHKSMSDIPSVNIEFKKKP
jgi:hypothetical protein